MYVRNTLDIERMKHATNKYGNQTMSRTITQLLSASTLQNFYFLQVEQPDQFDHPIWIRVFPNGGNNLNDEANEFCMMTVCQHR